VQRDRVPHKLLFVMVPAGGFGAEEFPGCVGAVDFEALVRGDERAGRVPAEVVQDGGDGMDFFVHVLESGDTRGYDNAVEP